MGKRKKVRSSIKTLNGALNTFRTTCLDPLKTHSFRDLHFPTSTSSLSTSTSPLSSNSSSLSLNSKRFFFDPCISKFITREPSAEWTLRRERVAMVMASLNPYRDFRDSMNEMVESQGLKDWSSLEELLQSYLRLNQKSNHGFIVEAFVDLIACLFAQDKLEQWSCMGGFPW